MKIISWNVNGLRACAQKGFLSFLEEEDPDVLGVQETKGHPGQMTKELTAPEGRISYFSVSHRKAYSGTATFLKKPAEDVKYGIGIRKFDFEGRFMVTKVNGIVIYNVYFPNGTSGPERHYYKQEFLRRFQWHLEKHLENSEPVIVMGDYNVAYMDHDVYDPGELVKESGFLPEEREWFQAFIKAGFIDTFRYLHPHKKDTYSWWSYRERARVSNNGWRIDHICVSPDLEKRIHRAEVMDQVLGSDHCPVLLELKN